MSADEPFNDPAKDYRTRYALPEHFLWHEADRPRIQFDAYAAAALALMPPPPIDVLDAGCGDGFLSQRLQHSGYRVYGYDYADRAIAYARLLVAGATFRVFDLRRLETENPFGRPFAAAMLVEVLEHIPPADHACVLAGLYRVLDPGGCVVVSVPSHRTPMNRWHYKHFALDEIRAMLGGAGFQVTDVVCLRRRSFWSSSCLWSAVQNRFYDLTIVRRGLRRLLLAGGTGTTTPDRAGRYVLKGVKA